MKNREIRFALELLRDQVKRVVESSAEDANSVALGLFENKVFVDVLEESTNIDFRFHTKKGWKTDDKPALIYDMKRIINIMEEILSKQEK